MAADRSFKLTEDFLKLQSARETAFASARPTAWHNVAEACEEALSRYPDEPLLGIWWTQASGAVQGFLGLAEGVGRITAMCLRWDASDYDLYEWVREKLKELILSIPLTEGENYTYTAVLNARLDPERAAAVNEAVSRRAELVDQHRPGLEALAAALRDLEGVVDRLPYNQLSFDDLVRLPERISAYLAHPIERVYVKDRGAMGLEAPEAASAGAAAAAAAEPRHATEVFVQIEGFPGDSTAAQHRGWIAARSYRHTMQPPAPEIVIEKDLDAASPKLYQACAAARTLPRVVFDLCRAPDDGIRVLRVELEDALITSITQETKPDTSLPMEAVTFGYGAVRWTYTQFGDGMLPEGVVAAWSRTTPTD